MQPRRLKILIVGAGPVGLTTALELSRRGIRARIIEANADLGPPNESRALAVNPRSLELLEPCGAAERIVARATLIRELRIEAGSRRLITIDTLAHAARFRGQRTLPQRATEEILLECLGAHGITPEWQTEFTGLDSSSDGQRPRALLASQGRAPESQAFDLIVGADGAHSRVRKAAGLDFPGQALPNVFHIADLRFDRPVESHYLRMRFFDPGVLVRIPIDERTVRFISTLDDFRARIDEEREAPVEHVPWTTDFKVSFRHVGAMSAGRVFLAGDAAHVHSPVGGRGMNLGIEDACWLAWLIAQGRESEYSALRMPAVRTVMAETRRNTRLVLMSNPISMRLRNLLVPRAARFDAVRSRGLRAALGFDTARAPWLDGA